MSSRDRARKMASALVVLAATGALTGTLGCPHREPPGHDVKRVDDPSVATARTSGTTAATPTAVAAVDAGTPAAKTWVAAVRSGEWDLAWKGFEALPADERAKPELRYAGARIAAARDDFANARSLLQDLENALPLLAEDIWRRSAEAKLHAGPYPEAAEYFVGRLTPKSQLKASEAYEKVGDQLRSKYACDRVILHDKRTREDEAAARERRFKLAGNPDDARWFVVNAPDLPFAHDAEMALARLDPGKPLSVAERTTR
ncbi:MAG: hypothetical protein U0169_17210, partial [Polyangiaceae bacterium]